MGEISMRIILITLMILVSTHAWGGSWNDKPVMCAEEQEVQSAIKEKSETLLFNAVQLTKVRSKEGLQERIESLPLQIYVNFDTKTFTVVEYHPEHKIYCIVSYGTDLNLLQQL